MEILCGEGGFAVQPTQKLYEADAFLRRFTAGVLACEAAGPGVWRAALSATAFYPEGGGQPCDTGTLGGAAVTDVHEEGGTVWHTVSAQLAPGTAVQGEIDWPRRLDHMQQHTGEHILSGCLHRLYGANNVGFHIGQPAVRMDIDLPLDAAQLAAAEAEANALVRADTPVRCFVPDADTLARTGYRSKKALEGPVRLVEAGGDVCACCGTHLAGTGQVGLIKILSAQNYKGGVRLAVACGQRAYAAVADAWADAEAAGRLLSAAPGRLAPAVGTALDNLAAQRWRAAALQRELCAWLPQAVPPGTRVLTVPGLDAEAAGALAQRMAAAVCAPCAVLAPDAAGDTARCALAAPGPADAARVRALGAELGKTFAARGGGPAGRWQGSLPLPDKKAGAAKAEAFLRRALEQQGEG